MTGKPKQRRKSPVAQKKPPIWQRPISYVIEAVVCLAVLGILGTQFYEYLRHADRFQVKMIRVDGAILVPGERIIAASGITQADNLLFLRAGQLAERVASLPEIKACRVYRSFPNKVVLEVEERVQVASLLLDNRAYAIDRESVVMHPIASPTVADTPFITNVADLRFVEVGQPAGSEALTEALEVWDAFSASPLCDSIVVSELAALNRDDIRMICDDLPYEIRWGRGDYETQTRRLAALWEVKDAALGCDEYLELRFGRDLACK